MPSKPPQPESRPRKLRILVTAGPTREFIDPVRYISNDSSGRMGFALAAAARARGHGVTLVHGPVSLDGPAGVRPLAVISAAEMLAVCRSEWPQHDILIMAAAVADYTPARPSATKRKKSRRDLVLRLKPTTDILKELSLRRRADQSVIGFALEDRDGKRNAERKLARKRLDAVVLNQPAAIGATVSRIEVLAAGGEWRTLTARRKESSARMIVELAEWLHAQRIAQV